ncbi:MAG: 2-C-methyl-D-erythritol 4-phosphate cytidylyltransferase [Aquabacterium sp.]
MKPTPQAVPRCHAVVPCAGVGERAGTAGPKQYQPLAGRAVVAHTLEALAAVAALDRIIVVLAAQDARFEAEVGPALAGRTTAARRGGATRAASVLAGLELLTECGADEQDWVLVHDAARCLLQPAAVLRLIDACRDDAVGGLLAMPVADTLKTSASQPARAQATLVRTDKWLAQTPQMFRLGMLRNALGQAGDAVTDESSALEAIGLQPLLVRGAADNLKVTWPEDFMLAEALLQARDKAVDRTQECL